MSHPENRAPTVTETWPDAAAIARIHDLYVEAVALRVLHMAYMARTAEPDDYGARTAEPGGNGEPS